MYAGGYFVATGASEVSEPMVTLALALLVVADLVAAVRQSETAAGVAGAVSVVFMELSSVVGACSKADAVDIGLFFPGS